MLVNRSPRCRAGSHYTVISPHLNAVLIPVGKRVLSNFFCVCFYVLCCILGKGLKHIKMNLQFKIHIRKLSNTVLKDDDHSGHCKHHHKSSQVLIHVQLGKTVCPPQNVCLWRAEQSSRCVVVLSFLAVVSKTLICFHSHLFYQVWYICFSNERMQFFFR